MDDDLRGDRDRRDWRGALITFWIVVVLGFVAAFVLLSNCERVTS